MLLYAIAMSPYNNMWLLWCCYAATRSQVLTTVYCCITGVVWTEGGIANRSVKSTGALSKATGGCATAQLCQPDWTHTTLSTVPMVGRVRQHWKRMHTYTCTLIHTQHPHVHKYTNVQWRWQEVYSHGNRSNQVS